MRIIETKVYTFNELSDEAKQHAIESLYDLNVDHEWWENVYEDAENVGLKIEGFDLGRRQECEGHFIQDALGVADAILREHGEQCETYKTAAKYVEDYWQLYCQEDADQLCMPGELRDWDFITYAEYGAPEDLEDLNKEFLRSLLEDYRIMLQKEYEYLTSEEAIIETIEANEYEFTEKGEMM